ncbi:unnamed protein product [Thlaspi arvense]|uniref:RING-CH-type domain-containing protein n=1 Tax=Thlaspi arvense TaxID=13288 RepID=A0AAU9STN0_THLAR|nr:unnamed protein product [Thlaspi arvense]
MDQEDFIEEIVDSTDSEETVAEIQSPPLCRMCLEEDGELTHLGCSCEGKLNLAHEQCVIKWFTSKQNKICEFCKKEAGNVIGDFNFKGLSGVNLIFICFALFILFGLISLLALHLFSG